MKPDFAPIDPFAMLVDPRAALDALSGSAALQSLDRRICRPLDSVRAYQRTAGQISCDEDIDAEPEASPEDAAAPERAGPGTESR
jgi:hypothetical protein